MYSKCLRQDSWQHVCEEVLWEERRDMHSGRPELKGGQKPSPILDGQNLRMLESGL